MIEYAIPILVLFATMTLVGLWYIAERTGRRKAAQTESDIRLAILHEFMGISSRIHYRIIHADYITIELMPRILKLLEKQYQHDVDHAILQEQLNRLYAALHIMEKRYKAELNN